jgi:hypothetical protein
MYDGTELQIVSCYRYVGLELNKHLDFTHTLNALASAGSRALKGILLKMHGINHATYQFLYLIRAWRQYIRYITARTVSIVKYFYKLCTISSDTLLWKVFNFNHINAMNGTWYIESILCDVDLAQ